MQLIATKDLRYASRDLKAGDRFEATETDAHILRATGNAEDADAGDDGLFERKDERAGGKGRGRYRRSDMRAED